MQGLIANLYRTPKAKASSFDLNMDVWLDRVRGSSSSPPLLVWSAAASATTLAVLAARSYLRRRISVDKPWKMIPGRYPILGHVPLIPSMDQILEVMEVWADQYGAENGTFVVDMAGSPYVVVCSQERAEEVLKHRPKITQRSHQLSEAVNSLGGTGVFAAEGEQWKLERKLVSAALNQKSVQDYLPTLHSISQRLIDKWLSETGETRIDDDLKAISSESIAKVSLNRDYDFLHQENHPVQKDIDTIMAAFNHRAFTGFRYWRIPLIGQYLDGKGWSIRRLGEVMNGVVKEYETIYKTNPAGESAGMTASTRRTFLDKLFEVMESEKTRLPRQRVVGNVLTLFLAGTDTTSKALLTAFYILAENEELQQRLRLEADGVKIEDMDITGLFTKAPHIKSFLHEVHRCYGSPLVGMEVTQPIPYCGSTLPAGSITLILSHYINQSNPDVPLGPNETPPTEFDPQRWLVVEESHVTCPTPGKGFILPSFGYGVRVCPGRFYTEALSMLILIRSLRDLEMRLATGHPRAKFIFNVNLIPDCGVTLKFTPRDREKA